MEVLPWEGHEHDARVQKSAQALNYYLRWCYRQLSAHPLNAKRTQVGLAPLNAVGVQRAGQKTEVQQFPEKWGFRGLALASGCLYRGLSLHLGLKTRAVKDTDDIEADLRERLTLAQQAREYDFVYVHTKAADEAAHTKDPRIKQRAIEALDRALAYAVQEIAADPETLLVITADHATNSAGTMIHSGETVPLLMVGRYTWRDRVNRFDEISCAQGSLGLVRGPELMYLVLNFLDRGKLYGLRDSPQDQPYFPGQYKPLQVEE